MPVATLTLALSVFGLLRRGQSALCGRVALVAMILGGGGELCAALRFAQPEVSLQLAEGAADAEAVFAFANEGSAPVRITKVQAGCGCTTPRLDQETYAPGEAGTLRATYHVGGRQGRQSVRIRVTTDEERSEPYEVFLKVDILTPVALQPRLVFWRVGEAAAPKTVQVRLADGFSLVGAVAGGSGFTTELGTATAGGAEILIRPAGTGSVLVDAVKVRVKQPDGATREYQVFARIVK